MKFFKTPLALLIGGVVVGGLIALTARDYNPFAVKRIAQTRRRSILLAFMTLPAGETWRRCFKLFLIFNLIAVPLGFLTGLLRLEVLKGSRRKYGGILLSLFIEPGVFEELFFRVLLLPHPEEGLSRARTMVSAVAGMVIFILAHPINGLTFSPVARPLFTDIRFLGEATLLGVTCSLAYLMSGSIWPPVLIHWLPVSVWILFLGGAKQVSRSVWWVEKEAGKGRV